MTDPALTVLMTVFNAGRFLDPAIRSITGQSFRNFEFLIVDDASTDGSVEVVEGWALRDDRIRLIRNEANKGQTPCLNQGLRLARGRWIARQDADDLSHPVRLFEQFQFTTMHPEVVLLGTQGRMVDGQDRRVGLLDNPLSAVAADWTAPFLNPFTHTAVMFRADILRDELGGYDENYRIAQDYELWTRVMARYPVANLPERLVCYRHLESSLSKTGSDLAFAEAGKISLRESERIFGRVPEPAEQKLMAAFREGLTSESRTEFWRFYERERRTFEIAHTCDLRRAAALHRLKASGSLLASDRRAAVAEIWRAARTDGRATAGWLAARYL
jgi:glycosyltransferase involved in cell wall biosynthesis